RNIHDADSAEILDHRGSECASGSAVDRESIARPPIRADRLCSPCWRRRVNCCHVRFPEARVGLGCAAANPRYPSSRSNQQLTDGPFGFTPQPIPQLSENSTCLRARPRNSGLGVTDAFGMSWEISVRRLAFSRNAKGVRLLPAPHFLCTELVRP